MTPPIGSSSGMDNPGRLEQRELLLKVYSRSTVGGLGAGESNLTAALHYAVGLMAPLSRCSFMRRPLDIAPRPTQLVSLQRFDDTLPLNSTTGDGSLHASRRPHHHDPIFGSQMATIRSVIRRPQRQSRQSRRLRRGPLHRSYR